MSLGEAPQRGESELSDFLKRIQSGDDGAARELLSRFEGEVLVGLRELMPVERRTILELKAEGLSSRDIGERLGISERTVQRVLEELRRRMETEWESP